MFSLADRALYVEALDLWIDSMRRRTRCYVSHGHSDHARPHGVVVSTPQTARICRGRFAARTRAGVPCTFEEHAFDEPWDEGEHRLTLFAAGHVLGSSQILIEGERGRFVYTGDFTLTPSFTAEAPRVERCDVLLMECTYGRPHYAFPPRDEVAAQIVAFARQTLEAGAVPLFFAYSLGKAQEAVAILGRAGIPLTVHHSIAAMCRAYEACGVELPPYEHYDASTSGAAGGAIVWPPAASTLPALARRRAIHTAALTGWALDRAAAVRYGGTRAFPLSDHADYPALLHYIELAQPRKVLLNHGPRDFTYRLRRMGIDAEYLEEHAQLALF